MQDKKITEMIQGFDPIFQDSYTTALGLISNPKLYWKKILPQHIFKRMEDDLGGLPLKRQVEKWFKNYNQR